jgi:hypothetical protein
LPIREVSSTNVKVTTVNFDAADVAAQNVRNFTLQLMEVS